MSKFGEPWKLEDDGRSIEDCGVNSVTGDDYPLSPEHAHRVVTCVNACANLNPAALAPLLDLLKRAVADQRHRERETYVFDETNFTSALEVALERLYDTGVTSEKEPTHPQAASDG